MVTPNESSNVGISPQRPLTFGEKAVGLTSNLGGSLFVTKIKAAYAAIIDDLNDARTAVGPGEGAQHFSVAITDAETAQMRAVKAVTWSN